MNAVNLGLLGLGRWVRESYIPILQELPNVHIVAVAARTAATRRFAGAQLGKSVAIYADFHDLLKDQNVDAVICALPNELHTEAITATVEAKRHILLEPPLGLTAASIRQVLHELSRTDRVIQADLELRYLPILDLVRAHVDEGRIGDLLMAKVRLWCDWGYGGGEWAQDAAGQGLFLWLGCWYLDVLDCIFRTVPTHVSVVGGHAMNGDLLDYGWATMDFPSGRIGMFEFSLVAPRDTDVSVYLLGSEGELTADLWAGTCRWRRGRESWQEDRRSCALPVHGFVGMRESIDDFVAAIREKRRPRADLEVCRRVHQTALACARSEAEKRTVPVEPMNGS